MRETKVLRKILKQIIVRKEKQIFLIFCNEAMKNEFQKNDELDNLPGFNDSRNPFSHEKKIWRTLREASKQLNLIELKSI